MSVAASRTYIVSLTRVSVSILKTLIQIKAGAANPLELLRARCSQSSSNTPTQLPIEIRRKAGSPPGTGTAVTLFNPVKLGPSNDPSAAAVGGASATGVNATNEGTNGDILYQDDFNYIGGFLWTPTQAKEQIYSDAAGVIALALAAAPGAPVTLSADLIFAEK